VAIARALVGQPEVLLADEPTGNLDSKTAREIMGLFGDLHRAGMTIIIVTHDAAVAAHCRRVVRLHDGHIVEDRLQDSAAA
jgi:putative ABC transport system ATP-binding protein